MRIYAKLKSDGFEIVYNVSPEAVPGVVKDLKSYGCVTDIEVEED